MTSRHHRIRTVSLYRNPAQAVASRSARALLAEPALPSSLDRLLGRAETRPVRCARGPPSGGRLCRRADARAR